MSEEAMIINRRATASSPNQTQFVTVQNGNYKSFHHKGDRADLSLKR